MTTSFAVKNERKNNLRLKNSPLLIVIYISVCAFVIYSSMYGFRKPYTVGEYGTLHFFGISYKVCLVIAQVLGYMCSKFLGIRFISSMKPENRLKYILLFIGIAWLALLLFALIPAPLNILCMFINGLPLGMVFGLVFGFLEGRKTTEIMGAILVTSFIFAAGVAKSLGKWLLLDCNINGNWMPFVAGAFFIIPLLVAVGLLQFAPAPNQEDIALRTVRNPMTATERKAFIRTFGFTLIPVVLSYAIFTITRDFCEDFVNELWAETGFKNNASIFTQSSSIISCIVLVVIAVFFLIKNNLLAFRLTHFLVMIGISISAISTFLFNANFIGPFSWILFAISGLYLAYLPFNCLYFERMLALHKIKGNVGFVMYIADAFGYLGTVSVLLIKEFIPLQYNWVNFFSFLFYTAAILGLLLMVLTLKLHNNLILKLWKKEQPLL